MFINALEASNPHQDKWHSQDQAMKRVLYISSLEEEGLPTFCCFLFKYVYIVQDNNGLPKGMRLFLITMGIDDASICFYERQMSIYN